MDQSSQSEETVRVLWDEYFQSLLRQDFSFAMSLLKRIGEIDPDNPEVHLKFGDLYAREGEIEAACRSYRISATSLEALGFVEEALDVYKSILSCNPSDEAALRRIGVLSASIDEAPSPAIHAQPAPPTEYHVPAIFATCSAEALDDLMRAAEYRVYENGADVVREGDPGDSIFIIESGKAMVSARGRASSMVVATLSSGDFFGEMALLTKRPRTATVTAFGPLGVYEISKDLLKRIADMHPEIIKNLVRYYSARAKDSIEKLKAAKKV